MLAPQAARCRLYFAVITDRGYRERHGEEHQVEIRARAEEPAQIVHYVSSMIIITVSAAGAQLLRKKPRGAHHISAIIISQQRLVQALKRLDVATKTHFNLRNRA